MNAVLNDKGGKHTEREKERGRERETRENGDSEKETERKLRTDFATIQTIGHAFAPFQLTLARERCQLQTLVNAACAHAHAQTYRRAILRMGGNFFHKFVQIINDKLLLMMI